MESRMTPEQMQTADAQYHSLVETRIRDGAYYPPADPLRGATPAALAAMEKDDPDIQLRRAFALEKAAQTNDEAYKEAMDLYRTVRDRREMDVRFILGRNYLNGTNGEPVEFGPRPRIGSPRPRIADRNPPRLCWLRWLPLHRNEPALRRP